MQLRRMPGAADCFKSSKPHNVAGTDVARGIRQARGHERLRLAGIHVPQSEDVEKFMREESHTPEISPPWRVVV